MRTRNANLVSIVVLLVVTGIFASRLAPHSGSSVTPEATRPTPLPSPVAEFVLQYGEERSFGRPGGSMFELEARIDYQAPAGAAYLLEMSVDGRPLGPLVNKAETLSE